MKNGLSYVQPAVPLSFEKMLSSIDDATDILEACCALRSIVDGKLDKPVTASELAAALNTIIVCDVVAVQVQSMRDPAYWEEDYHGE
jgi:hypothetical protein